MLDNAGFWTWLESELVLDISSAEYVEKEWVEPVLHELGHAFTLGYTKLLAPLSSNMRTSIALLPKRKQDKNEAEACAVELLLWERLGGDREELMVNLIPFAQAGLETWSNDYFTRQVRKHLTTEKTAGYVDEAMRYIENMYQTYAEKP